MTMLLFFLAIAASVLAGPQVGEAESIAYSIAGIVLALAFLAWGIRCRCRVWRVMSLTLMLVAVAKVVLFDLDGLGGLTRIASFVAPGFSLTAIGWIYGRFLKADETPAS